MNVFEDPRVATYGDDDSGYEVTMDHGVYLVLPVEGGGWGVLNRRDGGYVMTDEGQPAVGFESSEDAIGWALTIDLDQECPGCVGRGSGSGCCMCGLPIPEHLRREEGDPPEFPGVALDGWLFAVAEVAA